MTPEAYEAFVGLLVFLAFFGGLWLGFVWTLAFTSFSRSEKRVMRQALDYYADQSGHKVDLDSVLEIRYGRQLR